MTVIGLV